MKKTTYLMTLIAGVALALTPMTSRAADDAADKKGSGFVGKVTAYDAEAKTMTVENKKDSKTMEFTTTEATKIMDGDDKDADATAIAVGSRVRVMTAEEGGKEAMKVKVLPAKKGKKGDTDEDDDSADESDE